jgi:predicted secreted Zn-dependent protease
MRHFATLDPTVSSAYQSDTAQSRMTDDGCPLVPALPKKVERYKLPETPSGMAKTHWQRLRDGIELREQWHAVCMRMMNR